MPDRLLRTRLHRVRRGFGTAGAKTLSEARPFDLLLERRNQAKTWLVGAVCTLKTSVFNRSAKAHNWRIVTFRGRCALFSEFIGSSWSPLVPPFPMRGNWFFSIGRAHLDYTCLPMNCSLNDSSFSQSQNALCLLIILKQTVGLGKIYD